MKPTVLHPDHLLDRARRGALPPEGWQKLGAHLAACPACAWEQAATADFAREGAAAALDDARLGALVAGAMARAGVAGVPAARLGSARSRSSLGPWLAAAAMVAAGVLVALSLPAREATRGEPVVATSEASLDAGAIGAPSGGDS